MSTAKTSTKQPGSPAGDLQDVLKQIDALELSDRLIKWKDARKKAQFVIRVERDRLATESWKETEGDDLEIRRAKLFKKIAEELPIGILDTDLIVGRQSTGLLDAVTQTDVAGDYIPGLWDDDDELDMTMSAKSGLSKEDREVLGRQPAIFIRGRRTRM